MLLIIDFIPNHTGKMSEWFKRSQRKEGKYTDYYIWALCDPKNDRYPNNWVSLVIVTKISIARIALHQWMLCTRISYVDWLTEDYLPIPPQTVHSICMFYMYIPAECKWRTSMDLWWRKKRMFLPSVGGRQAWVKSLESWRSTRTWGFLTLTILKSWFSKTNVLNIKGTNV